MEKDSRIDVLNTAAKILSNAIRNLGGGKHNIGFFDEQEACLRAVTKRPCVDCTNLRVTNIKDPNRMPLVLCLAGLDIVDTNKRNFGSPNPTCPKFEQIIFTD